MICIIKISDCTLNQVNTVASTFCCKLFVCHRLSIMATGDPMMNGEVPHSPSNPGMLEETLHQMNILIQENRDLKGMCGGVLGC